MNVSTINEQIVSMVDQARELIWEARGLTEDEKEKERLFCILKKPAPSSSPMLDRIMEIRNKK